MPFAWASTSHANMLPQGVRKRLASLFYVPVHSHIEGRDHFLFQCTFARHMPWEWGVAIRGIEEGLLVCCFSFCFWELFLGVWSICELSVYAGCAFLYLYCTSIKVFKSVQSLSPHCSLWWGNNGHNPKAHKINYVTTIWWRTTKPLEMRQRYRNRYRRM